MVNARFAKPLDTELLFAHAASAKLLVTMEDHVLSGGFGSAVLEALADAGSAAPVVRLAWPDRFVHHGDSVAVLRAENGLSPDDLFTKVSARYERVR